MGNRIIHKISLYGQRFASGLVIEGKYFLVKVRKILTLPLKGGIDTPMTDEYAAIYSLPVKPFGEILKAARLSKGLTRKEAAEELDLSPKTLVKYELMGISNDGQTPSLPRLVRMIDLFDIDPRYLLASVSDTFSARKKILQGAHLAKNKTEPFMIEQLGFLSDAINVEIEEIDVEVQLSLANMDPWEAEKQGVNLNAAKRFAHGRTRRKELLKKELKNIEEISLFSIMDGEIIHDPSNIFWRKKQQLKNEPEDTVGKQASSGSEPPQSETQGIDHDD